MTTALNIRRQIIKTSIAMNALGINRGTSGNVSARHNQGCLITPSGLRYEMTKPNDIVYIDKLAKPHGKFAPSSEWRFHHDIYHNRSDVGAIVHTHSSFATSLSCLRMNIPAFHYMVAICGGDNIRCATYATFGTQKLSDSALSALKDRKACLLANHGMICIEETLERALKLAVEVEALCEQYWRALQIGKPKVLSKIEMQTVLKKFQSYGQIKKPTTTDETKDIQHPM
ncbi:MAG: class II aldolase/adducin family protein [Proteobacteria bacterium]|nr:class II aldolase/adducin family protein [Pseudomonadota bacterium]MDA1331448.1 class II aldolase/adducin family protein [Pseudomonadota bacterium]